MAKAKTIMWWCQVSARGKRFSHNIFAFRKNNLFFSKQALCLCRRQNKKIFIIVARSFHESLLKDFVVALVVLCSFHSYGADMGPLLLSDFLGAYEGGLSKEVFLSIYKNSQGKT